MAIRRWYRAIDEWEKICFFSYKSFHRSECFSIEAIEQWIETSSKTCSTVSMEEYIVTKNGQRHVPSTDDDFTRVICLYLCVKHALRTKNDRHCTTHSIRLLTRSIQLLWSWCNICIILFLLSPNITKSRKYKRLYDERQSIEEKKKERSTRTYE